MKKLHLLLLSLLSGVLLTLAWPADGFPGLLFIALVPMLFIEDYIHRNKERFHLFSVLFYTSPGFLVWTSLTTWWIWNASPAGGSAAVIANALFMAFVFNLYHVSKRYIYRPGKGFFILVFYWLSFEYVHLNWDLNWPWLNLGNGFANYVKWIQWYEFTGTFGGSLWVLMVNILVYWILSNGPSRKLTPRIYYANVIFLGLILAVPLLYSFIRYANYVETGTPVDVVVVQPNVDPYTEQYELPPPEVIRRNFDLAKTLIDPSVEVVVCPESALQESIWERKLEYSESLGLVQDFTRDHPQLAVIIGASTFKEYHPGEAVPPSARKFRDNERFYDAYNTVFYIDTGKITQWSHKSRLTPGVEMMPYPKYMRFLEKYALDLGGTIGTLGTDDNRVVFTRPRDSLKMGAAICYESVFGEFFSEFVINGANIMFVVTNDGWWGDTPGYRQHLSFSRMRAIETRRSIGRSANTGISCFISQKGEVFQKTEYWVPAAIRQKINANDKITFYTRYGDYIARVAVFFTFILLLYSLAAKTIKRRRITQK
ncbi:MAG: apolipoprotein N-acyltransferase [Bacteroidetes bacterium]|nr:apolipoprotein N-acyltransferase [Bacteroidota bacterium]